MLEDSAAAAVVHSDDMNNLLRTDDQLLDLEQLHVESARSRTHSCLTNALSQLFYSRWYMYAYIGLCLLQLFLFVWGMVHHEGLQNLNSIDIWYVLCDCLVTMLFACEVLFYVWRDRSRYFESCFNRVDFAVMIVCVLAMFLYFIDPETAVVGVVVILIRYIFQIFRLCSMVKQHARRKQILQLMDARVDLSGFEHHQALQEYEDAEGVGGLGPDLAEGEEGNRRIHDAEYSFNSFSFLSQQDVGVDPASPDRGAHININASNGVYGQISDPTGGGASGAIRIFGGAGMSALTDIEESSGVDDDGTFPSVQPELTPPSSHSVTAGQRPPLHPNAPSVSPNNHTSQDAQRPTPRAESPKSALELQSAPRSPPRIRSATQTDRPPPVSSKPTAQESASSEAVNLPGQPSLSPEPSVEDEGPSAFRTLSQRLDSVEEMSTGPVPDRASSVHTVDTHQGEASVVSASVSFPGDSDVGVGGLDNEGTGASVHSDKPAEVSTISYSMSLSNESSLHTQGGGSFGVVIHTDNGAMEGTEAFSVGTATEKDAL